MAINRKSLQKLISRPEAFDPSDLEDEEQFRVPEEVQDAIAEETGDIDDTELEDDGVEEEIEEPVIQQDVDDSSEMRVQSSPDESQFDPEIMEQIKRLKSGEPMDDMGEEDNQEIASDTSASTELRKKALQRIKQKYLGQ